MSRRNHRRLVAEVLIAVALSFSSLEGCGGNSGSSSPPTLTSIAITPANAAVSVGSNQQLTAEGIYSDGTMADLTSSVSWSSSDKTMASISSPGLATAAAIGRPEITATSGGITGSTRLIVVAGPSVARFAYSVGGTTIFFYTVEAASGQLQLNGSLPLGNVQLTIAIDPAGKFAYATSGINRVTAFTIDPAGGELTAISDYGTGALPYFTGVDPSGSFIYTANAQNDDISGYGIDRISGKLTPIAGSPFRDPGVPSPPNDIDLNSIAFHPSGKFVYVTNEIFENISVYAIDAASGALTAVAGSPVSTGNQEPSAIAIDPAGKIAIVIGTGTVSPTVSTFTIDATTGALTAAAASSLPQGSLVSVVITPSGKYAYVADQEVQGDNISVSNIFGFSIDSTTGALTPLAAGPFMAGPPLPQSLVADPSGKFLYLLNSPPGSASSITTYAIDAGTGDLTAVSSLQCPVPPGGDPSQLAIALSP